MSNATEPEGPAPKPKKPFWRPSRIVLWIVLLIAVVGIALEGRARWACTSTYKAVDQAMAEADEKGGGVYKKDLEKLLSGSPERESTASGEVLTWRGVKRHRLRLEYGPGGFLVKAQRE